jgi:hypothetical protein
LLRDLNEEYRLRVLECGVLVKRFGPKTVERTRGGREGPKEDLLKEKRPFEDLGIDGSILKLIWNRF